VIEFLSRHQAELEASASPEEFNNVVRDAVLVLQWEGYESVRAGALRDFFMADNVSWLLEQAGPDAKMVVSGHNIHMNYREDWQGEFMREEFGDDLVSIGLTFGEGSFNAITRLLSGEFRGLEVQRSGPAPSSSYEYRFAATSLSAFALDLKNADLVVGQSDWLATPFWLRNVGSVYEPEDPAFYFFRDIPITELFDGILYVDTTTESLLLPFNYPSEF
jgi:erythromycin esterase